MLTGLTKLPDRGEVVIYGRRRNTEGYEEKVCQLKRSKTLIIKTLNKLQ